MEDVTYYRRDPAQQGSAFIEGTPMLQPNFSSFALKILAACMSMAACLGCTSVWQRAQGSEAMRVADALREPIDAYRTVHGTYPDTLGQLDLPSELAAQVAQQKISYRRELRPDRFVVGFVVPGLVHDSSCGYGSHRQEWQCFVK